MTSKKELSKKTRQRRVRKKVTGSMERPRLNVFRSINHIYANIIDDMSGNTIVTASSIDKELKKKIKTGGNLEAARVVGEMIAKRGVDKGIKKVVFDRGGCLFHGRIKALADAARKEGLEF